MFKSTAVFSASGEVALRCEEGERLHAYRDTRGILTIGVGHSINAPSRIVFLSTTTWTKEYADHVFMLDLQPFVKAANDGLTAPLNQHQFDALISLEYNIGMGGLRRSHLLDVINHHGPDTVTEADFLAYAHPSELKGRRLREWAMYSRGVYRAA